MMVGYYTWIHRTSMRGVSVVYLVPISFQRFIIQVALSDMGLMPLLVFLRFYPSYFSGFLCIVLRASVCWLCTKLHLEQGVAAVVKESITFTISPSISHAPSQCISTEFLQLID
jgi:hypothetical protein